MTQASLTRSSATLQKSDGTSVPITLYRDEQGDILRVSDVPGSIRVEDSSARGFHVATAISDVKNTGHLRYRGYRIEDLVEHCSYEEVIYLLLRGELPNAKELEGIRRDLAHQAVISDAQQKQLIDALKAIRVDEKTDATSLLSTAISVMNTTEKLGQQTEQQRYISALRIQAVMPALIGLVNARLKAGNRPEQLDNYHFLSLRDIAAANNRSSYASFMLSSLHQQAQHTLEPEKIAAMNKYLILHAEHGMNLSTFTARTVDSGESKEGGWRTQLGALQSLAGNRHGNASVDALQNLKNILKRPGASIEDKVNHYIADVERAKAAKTAQKRGENVAVPRDVDGSEMDGTVEGFGHKIYTKGKDPRATALQAILKTINSDSDLLKVALTLEAKLSEHPEFGKKPGDRSIAPNVDFCSGILLTQYLGIDERLMTAMFAVGRTAGWQAHAMEAARDSKAIVRPEAISLTAPREFMAMDQRTVPTQVTNAQGTPQFPKAHSWNVGR